MAYNKARAEKEWLKWKIEEESKLRELGVDEDTIQRLHTYDWSVFKSDRRFYEPQVDLGEWFYSFPAEDTVLPIYTVHALLGAIDDRQLRQILATTDPKTLEAVFLRICGYTTQEIGQKLGLSPKALNLRMLRLRKKIKKLWNE